MLRMILKLLCFLSMLQIFSACDEETKEPIFETQYKPQQELNNKSSLIELINAENDLGKKAKIIESYFAQYSNHSAQLTDALKERDNDNKSLLSILLESEYNDINLYNRIYENAPELFNDITKSYLNNPDFQYIINNKDILKVKPNIFVNNEKALFDAVNNLKINNVESILKLQQAQKKISLNVVATLIKNTNDSNNSSNSDEQKVKNNSKTSSSGTPNAGAETPDSSTSNADEKASDKSTASESASTSHTNPANTPSSGTHTGSNNEENAASPKTDTKPTKESLIVELEKAETTGNIKDILTKLIELLRLDAPRDSLSDLEIKNLKKIDDFAKEQLLIQEKEIVEIIYKINNNNLDIILNYSQDLKSKGPKTANDDLESTFKSANQKSAKEIIEFYITPIANLCHEIKGNKKLYDKFVLEPRWFDELSSKSIAHNVSIDHLEAFNKIIKKIPNLCLAKLMYFDYEEPIEKYLEKFTKLKVNLKEIIEDITNK
jgi:hypothetical protein